MKNTLTLFAACLLTTASAFSQTEFNKLYSVPGQYLEWDNSLQLSDNSYIMMGYYEMQSGDDLDNGMLQRTNAAGNVLATQKTAYSYSDYSNDYLYLGSATPDGNFVAGGETGNYSLLSKYDKNLNMLWHHQYVGPGDNYSYLKAVNPAADSGFMLLMKRGGGEYGDAIIKTDSLGNILWSEAILGTDNTGGDMKQCSDGNYVFVEEDQQAGVLNVIKIDTAGSIIWGKVLQADDGVYYYNVSLACAPSGSIYITGSAVKKPFIIKLDAAGSIQWKKETQLVSGYAFYSQGTFVDWQGNIVFGGRYSNENVSPNVRRPYLFKFDSTGSFLSAVIYPYLSQADASVNSISTTRDSGYIITGSATDSNGISQTFGLKTDKDLGNCGSLPQTGFFTFSDMYTGSIRLRTEVADAGITEQAADSVVNSSQAVAAASGYLPFCSVILPVSITNFSAVLQNGVVNLQWKTAQEQNLSHYAVERSNTINNAFRQISSTTARNLATAQVYNSIDEQPLSGTSYYRLRSVDADGKSTLSKVVPINISTLGTIFISPNPVIDAVHVHINAVAAAQIQLQVTDMSGKVLLTQNRAVSAGANAIQLPATFSRGMYILKVTGTGKPQALKFVK